MPLSEHEQRLLEQIEQALYAEDPKFASLYTTTDLRTHYRRRALRAGIGFLVGLGLLVAGAVTALIPMGVAGFVVMLAATSLIVASLQRMLRRGAQPVNPVARPVSRRRWPHRDRRSRPSLFARLEQRFLRRFDR